MEEGCAGGNTDSKGEQGQAKRAEFTGDAQLNTVCFRPRSQDDREEQHRGGTQSDSTNFDAAKRHPDADQDEQEQHGLFSQK